MKKADYEMITAYFLKAEIPKAKTRRSVQVHIILGPRQRACDGSNYDKSLLDGLVECGAIKNDNRQWLEQKPYTFDRADKPATVITLDDVAPLRGWFEAYSCGCVSEYVERKKDLAGYCGKHGNDRSELHRIHPALVKEPA